MVYVAHQVNVKGHFYDSVSPVGGSGSTMFLVSPPVCVHAYDLAVITETEEELIKRLNNWKDNVESQGIRVNMNRTNVMISGERQ